MKLDKIAIILLTGLMILAGLIVCGLVGYLNDSGRASPNFGFPKEPSATPTPIAIDLVYCYNPVDLCIMSFGQDNSGNLLIAMRNNVPGLKEFYAKLRPARTFLASPTEALTPTLVETLNPNLTVTPGISPSPSETLEVAVTATGTENPGPEPTTDPDLYICQKVQFASDIYYCMGNLLPDGTMVTMNIYSKSDDRLIASGEILVSTEATPQPAVTATTTPTTTVTVAVDTETPTVTVTVEPSKTTTPTKLPTSTQVTPAYLYP